MGSDIEPAKQILPYLQRADELQKHEPLVAYYCRLYAMERGLKIPAKERTKTTSALLISLMKQLEKDKKSIKLGPEDNLYLEGFALNVFSKADKQDRAGRADLSTAKTFYAASIFFEIMNQFGEVHPDLEQKQKYAAWKAADIRKALKEGRKPEPGPPGGDSSLSSMSSEGYDLKPNTSDPGTRPTHEPDLSSQAYHKGSSPHSTDAPPSFNVPSSPSGAPTPPSYQTDDFPVHSYHQTPPASGPENFPQHPSTDRHEHYHQPPPTDGQENYHQIPPNNTPENPTYSQTYHHQPYQQEPQQPLPHHYAHDSQSFSNPNLQSYPSFTESSLPGVQSHYPSYYQDSGASYTTSSAPDIVNYQSSTQYGSNGRSGSAQEAGPPSAPKYKYDSSYEPAPDKVAEAHKAAKLAAGSLAFDDVPAAVEYLIKSLELLTNPSVSQ
ncbi:membrane traffic protein [Lithospermum erythrorhizon]|uniref:Membrane traffic protein n=1 Tax=Lithospermum erythrorhizon TaxID=34254 RepID=A0AAV3NI37_LITER